jgi:hypothetical protein
MKTNKKISYKDKLLNEPLDKYSEPKEEPHEKPTE